MELCFLLKELCTMLIADHLSESKASDSGNWEATFVTNISDSATAALLWLLQRSHLENTVSGWYE